ncbi:MULTISPECIES: hypothetical protein [Hyphomicrobiales]|jgi:hypothetical protein|uniref:hypothetical protein n=1 Tax=Hyphomicrobiales TaxID=356 RepID=UPI000360A172|nr:MULTISPECIES: hypothetical protein [Phyllobacteriaceae]MCX8571699.1 hypothetical protein [Aminobacter sp. MET-1]
MADRSEKDTHEFLVTAVEHARDDKLDGVALMLIDARGGRVRLHMHADIAEVLREHISAALAKTTGP